jgi:hypothetical protein
MIEFDDAFAPVVCSPLPYGVVWLDPQREIYAIVDLIDLAWVQQWRWTGITSKSGPKRIVKWYARRTVSMLTGVAGARAASRRCVNLWLHKEILLRAVGAPPSKAATIGDHINGNSLDCRRSNLRWSTASENRLNLFGSASHQLRLGFKAVGKRHRNKPMIRAQQEFLT